VTPLKALIGLVFLLFDRFFPPKRYAWPDGEQPLIDHHPTDYPEDWGLRWDGDSLISAGDGSATEACVEPTAEGPEGAGVRSPAPSGTTNVTAGLLIAAAIGLREYAASDYCEAPVYWSSISDQIDPK
jgi:hypothetical protein